LLVTNGSSGLIPTLMMLPGAPSTSHLVVSADAADAAATVSISPTPTMATHLRVRIITK
jgi:hypothetical protein